MWLLIAQIVTGTMVGVGIARTIRALEERDGR